MAHTLAKHDTEAEITVFLIADAALCAKAGQKTPDGFYNIEWMLRRVLPAGWRVLICLAHVTNQMGTIDGDFEKGEANGTADALFVLSRIVNRLR